MFQVPRWDIRSHLAWLASCILSLAHNNNNNKRCLPGNPKPLDRKPVPRASSFAGIHPLLLRMSAGGCVLFQGWAATRVGQ